MDVFTKSINYVILWEKLGIDWVKNQKYIRSIHNHENLRICEQQSVVRVYILEPDKNY